MMGDSLNPLPPNGTIGIVGGGQLGRMLASSAAKLGYRVVILEPAQDCPAAQLANCHIVASYDDPSAIARLVSGCDVVTYEFENVPLAAARAIEKEVPLYPPSRALEVSQDRLVEKNFLQSVGIDVAPFVAIESVVDVAAALKKMNGAVLKTRRFGYDGKGQHVFQPGSAVDSGLIARSLSEIGQHDAISCVLEELIDFRGEFSIIAARGQDGRVVSFDPAANVHESGILRRSVVPGGLCDATVEKARDIANRVLDALDYVGVVGIEFFETEDGLLVNEIAPRVHNTGHWSVEACHVSQFDQHIRAIAGLPLGTTARHSDCEMINLLGDEIDRLDELAGGKTDFVTLYGKSEAREGRKMGHVTRLWPQK